MLLALKRVGRHAHQQIIELGSDSDVSVGNCLVDMHTRCGSMEDACRVFFHKIPSCDVVKCTRHWNHFERSLVQVQDSPVAPGEITKNNTHHTVLSIEQLLSEGVG